MFHQMGLLAYHFYAGLMCVQVLDGDDAASNSDDSDFGDKVREDMGYVSTMPCGWLLNKVVLLSVETYARQIVCCKTQVLHNCQPFALARTCLKRCCAPEHHLCLMLHWHCH